MPSMRDKKGRPIAVVPASASSPRSASAEGQLGQADRRRLRHPPHHPLLHRRAQDPRSPAPSISCRSSRVGAPRCANGSAEIAAEEAIARGRHRPQGRLSRARCFSPSRRSRSNGRTATRSPAPAGANDAITYDDLLRATSPQFGAFYERFMFGSVADQLADRFGTKGSPISLSTACASGATAIQLGVEAIRRGETDAALCIGTDGSVNAGIADPLFAAVGAVDAEQSAATAAKPFSKNRDGFVMAEGAGALVLESLEARHGARRQDPRRHRGLRRDGGFVPSHPLEPGRQADHRLHPQRHRRRGPRARRHRLHQCPRHRHAGKRQDGIPRRVGGVRRARQEHPDLVQQVDDRPYAVGRRRGRGGVLAA